MANGNGPEFSEALALPTIELTAFAMTLFAYVMFYGPKAQENPWMLLLRFNIVSLVIAMFSETIWHHDADVPRRWLKILLTMPAFTTAALFLIDNPDFIAALLKKL